MNYRCFLIAATLLLFTPQRELLSQTIQVRIGGAKNICLVPLVALKRGYLKEQGIEATFQKIMTGKMTMDAVNSQSVDLGCIVDSNIAFISFQKADLQVLARVQTRTDDGLIYRSDASIASPADLKGKSVGYLPATTSHIFLARLLNKHGLTFSDITPVILQPPTMLSALRGGRVSAVSIWEPWRHGIRSQKNFETAEFQSSPALYPSATYLATTKRTLKRLGQHRQKFNAAFRKALHWIEQNPEEAQQFYSTENRIPIETTRSIWPQVKYRYEAPNNGEQVVLEVASWIKATLPNYRHKSPLPIDSIMNHDFIAKAQ